MMMTLKSFISKPDLDGERLLEDEANSSESGESDGASCYSGYQECCEVTWKTPEAYSESANSMLELISFDKNETGGKDLPSFALEKLETTKNEEASFPDKDRLRNFQAGGKSLSGHMKCWNLLLRCRRESGIKLPHCEKSWRAVVVKLEEASLKFHAEDFESSPPFKIVHLTWFHCRRMSVKTQMNQGGFFFSTVLVNALHSTRGRRARDGLKEAKVGCANYDVLLDFIEIVQMCVSNFPAFRRQGVRYKVERVLVHVHDVSEVVQGEQGNVTFKQVQIMLRAKISASPECSLQVKHAERFSGMPDVDDIRFHKCVQSYSSNNATVTARFRPLDDCWFHLMSWVSFGLSPPPLRCDATLTASRDGRVQLRADIFTSSTRLEVKSATNIMLRFHIPSECLERGRKSAAQTIQHCTSVTKGNVSYNPNSDCILWSIPKLSFEPCRNFFLSGKPVASILTWFSKTQLCCNTLRTVKVAVKMDFTVKGNAQSSEVEIQTMKLGAKLFGKFKTSTISSYHVEIPVTCRL